MHERQIIFSFCVSAKEKGEDEEQTIVSYIVLSVYIFGNTFILFMSYLIKTNIEVTRNSNVMLRWSLRRLAKCKQTHTAQMRKPLMRIVQRIFLCVLFLFIYVRHISFKWERHVMYCFSFLLLLLFSFSSRSIDILWDDLILVFVCSKSLFVLFRSDHNGK